MFLREPEVPESLSLPSRTNHAAAPSYRLSIDGTQKYQVCSAGLQSLDKMFLPIDLKARLKVLVLFSFLERKVKILLL